jgi:hypothetical protein
MMVLPLTLVLYVDMAAPRGKAAEQSAAEIHD